MDALIPLEKALAGDDERPSRFRLYREYRLYLVLDRRFDLAQLRHRKRDEDERWQVAVRDMMHRTDWRLVSRNPAVHVSFTDPRHGWLNLTIGLQPDAHYRHPPESVIDVSEVFDPFDDLLDWAARVSQGELPAEVEIDEEGQVKTLEATWIGKGPDVLFTVRDAYQRFLCLSGVVDRLDLVAAFARAFIRFFPGQFKPEEWDVHGDETEEELEIKRKRILEHPWLAPWYVLAVRREREFSQSGGAALNRSDESPYLAPDGWHKDVLHVRESRSNNWRRAIRKVFQIHDHEIEELTAETRSSRHEIWQSPAILVMMESRETQQPTHRDFPNEVEVWWKAAGVPGGADSLAAIARELKSGFLVKDHRAPGVDAYIEYLADGSSIPVLI